ncbi:MAG TPA: hypothetical protein VMF89_22115, partial [Polyangiales bacterium]|nr:hypothetical protein [Polyangiales bacterium]
TLQSKVSLWMLCVALGACSGAKKHDGDAASDDETDAGEVIGEEVDIGDPVDVDGDGHLDGEAVDSDGDGVPDSVDTDGDGKGDVPLPGAEGELDAGMSSGSSDAGDAGRVLIGSDSGTIPFPSNDAGQILCGSGPCACSDGKDNDMDGVADLADPECVSSWDNDEASFATGISGDNRDDACQDCFFDGNSGSGNDGCYLPSSCLSKGNASSGRGRCDSCEQSAQCKNFCKAYTPNGCDCFGCCTVRLANGSNVNVALGNGCNIDGNNVTGCNSCVPNDSCRNECGKCELCPGKTVDDLPDECFQSPPANDGGTNGSDGGTSANDGGSSGSPDGGTQQPPQPPPVYTCEDGAQVCGAGLPACPNGHACDFGCCVLVPIILL